MQPRDRAAIASAWSRRADALERRIDCHREHDRAIAIVDDERRGAGLALGIVEPREPHAALLAELDRDLLEQPDGLGICERRMLVAFAPLEPRQPTQRAHALAERREILAVRRDDADPVGRIGGCEPERDAARASSGRRTLDDEPGRSEPLHHVRADARRIRERLELEQIPRRAVVDQLASERRARTIFPARPREQVERRWPRPGIAEHAQLARVEQRDLHGAAVERGEADDLARADAGRVMLRSRARRARGARPERVVIRACHHGRSQLSAKQRTTVAAGRGAPLRLDGAQRRQVAHHGDIDRHALRCEGITTHQRPCPL
jgi:hypothetical protein